MDINQLTSAKNAESLDEILRGENLYCADCNQHQPEWVSLGFATFVCIQCSGYHRSLGTHITLVRSIKLDVWDQLKHVQIMEVGGNQRFRLYAESISLTSPMTPDKTPTSSIPPTTTAKPDTRFDKYNTPKLLYYSEILNAQIEEREPKPFNFEEWCIQPHSLTTKASTASENDSLSQKVWLPDSSALHCMICQKKFSLLTRKHHCRKCGRVLCNDCAPSNNSRPIFEKGLKQPVRHCRDCFKSPSVAWKASSPSRDHGY